jgi:hypothetical protein
MQRWAILSGSGVVILIGLLAWREWTHAGNRSAWEAESIGLQENLSAQSLELKEKEEQLAEANAVLAELEVNHESLRDRTTNLEAQRNHLRAETDRQSERARLAEATVLEIRAELEQARQRALELSAIPRELQAQVDQAQARVDELEGALDTRTGLQSVYPAALNVEGVTTDGSVFALTGAVPDSTTLPLPIYLCQKDSIKLEGWINRLENGVAIGHVEEWRTAASTLVKGEKVFILPRQRHEADN